MIQPGFYRHFKGGLYQVLGIARHSENLEQLVVYQALYGEGGLFVRPLSMFDSQVMVDGESKPRFNYLGQQLPAQGE